MSRIQVKELVVNITKLINYYISKIFYNEKLRPIIPENNVEEIVIIGNGPSLNNVSLDKISNEKYTFYCMNDFPLASTSLFLKIKPKYYSAFDDASYNAQSLHTKNETIQKITANNLKIFEILNNVTWDMTYICFSHQNPPITNPHIKIIHINSMQYTGKYNRFTLYSKNKATFGYGNSILGALYFNIVRKVKNIYLVGFDFSIYAKMYIDESNNICWDDEHYYGIEKRVLNGNDIRYQNGDYYKIIREYAYILENLNYAKEYAIHNNVKIYNTSLNSYIDTFEKIPIEKIYTNE